MLGRAQHVQRDGQKLEPQESRSAVHHAWTVAKTLGQTFALFFGAYRDAHHYYYHRSLHILPISGKL